MSAATYKVVPKRPRNPDRKSDDDDRHKSRRMFRLPDKLADVLDEEANRRLIPSTTAIIVEACIEYLQKRGKWPTNGNGKAH